MKKTIKIAGLLVVTFIALVLLQNHTNSLKYTMRDCTEVSDNSGYIGFKCPVRHYSPVTVYVPYSQREQVESLLSPIDARNGSI